MSDIQTREMLATGQAFVTTVEDVKRVRDNYAAPLQDRIRELEAQLEAVTAERDALMGEPAAVHAGAQAAIAALRQSARQAAAIQAGVEALEPFAHFGTITVTTRQLDVLKSCGLASGVFQKAYAALAKLREVQGE